MKHLVIKHAPAVVFLLLVSLAAPVAAASSWPALVTAAEVRERLATPGLRIVDLRGAEAYGRGHADGAVSMPVARWKAAAAEGRLPEVIGDAGIHPDRPLLLVHADTGPGNFADAAWIAWELRSRGIPSVSLLAGGMAAWEAAGIRVTDRVHDHRRYRLDYPRAEAALVETPELDAIVGGAGRVALIEARVADAPEDDHGALPAVSLGELLGSGEALADPAGLLERLKNAPLPWGVERVIILGDTPEAAPAFWFLASEILGIDGLAVGAAPGGLGLAAHATGGHAGVGL